MGDVEEVNCSDKILKFDYSIMFRNLNTPFYIDKKIIVGFFIALLYLIHPSAVAITGRSEAAQSMSTGRETISLGARNSLISSQSYT